MRASKKWPKRLAIALSISIVFASAGTYFFNKTASTAIPRSKALEDGLSFCDFLAGAVQSHFEDSQSEPFNILSPYIFLHYPW